MGGVSGCLPEDELAGDDAARPRAGRPTDDTVTRARLLLDEAWIAWRFGREYRDGRADTGGARAGAIRPTTCRCCRARSTRCAPWRGARSATTTRSSTAASASSCSPSRGRRRPARDRAQRRAAHDGRVAGRGRRATLAAAEYADQARELDLSGRHRVLRLGPGAAAGLLPRRVGQRPGDGGRRARVRGLHQTGRRSRRWARRSPARARSSAIGATRTASEDWFRFASSVTSDGRRAEVGRGDAPGRCGPAPRAVRGRGRAASTNRWAHHVVALVLRRHPGRGHRPRGGGRSRRADSRCRGVGRRSPLRAGRPASSRGRRQAGRRGLLRESLTVFRRSECPYQAARTGLDAGRRRARRGRADVRAAGPRSRPVVDPGRRSAGRMAPERRAQSPDRSSDSRSRAASASHHRPGGIRVLVDEGAEFPRRHPVAAHVGDRGDRGACGPRRRAARSRRSSRRGRACARSRPSRRRWPRPDSITQKAAPPLPSSVALSPSENLRSAIRSASSASLLALDAREQRYPAEALDEVRPSARILSRRGSGYAA